MWQNVFAFDGKYTLSPPDTFNPPCAIETLNGHPVVVAADKKDLARQKYLDGFIEHIIAFSLDPENDLNSEQIKNLILEVLMKRQRSGLGQKWRIYEWENLQRVDDKVMVRLAGKMDGKLRVFSRSMPSGNEAVEKFFYGDNKYVWRWDEPVQGEDDALVREIARSDYPALLRLTQTNEDLAFVECKRHLENDLAVYNEDHEFTGFYNASIPNIPEFRDDFPGADLRRTKLAEHLKHVNRYNYASFNNLINYILSWTRDDMVNTWFYFLDWKFYRDPVSRNRCARTYRAVLDFYQSGSQRKVINKAIAQYAATGKRCLWSDPDVSIAPRLNPMTGEDIPADLNKSLQMDVLGVLLTMIGLLL
jgi:hypothetical protein